MLDWFHSHTHRINVWYIGIYIGIFTYFTFTIQKFNQLQVTLGHIVDPLVHFWILIIMKCIQDLGDDLCGLQVYSWGCNEKWPGFPGTPGDNQCIKRSDGVSGGPCWPDLVYTVDGRNPAPVDRVVYHYIPGGAGFPPSAVVLAFSNHFWREQTIWDKSCREKQSPVNQTLWETYIVSKILQFWMYVSTKVYHSLQIYTSASSRLFRTEVNWVWVLPYVVQRDLSLLMPYTRWKWNRLENKPGRLMDVDGWLLKKLPIFLGSWVLDMHWFHESHDRDWVDCT